MRDWSVLNSKMITWSSEISDPLIKKNYLEWCLDNKPNIPDKDFTQPPKAMPDEYKKADPIEGYREYYKKEKKHIAKWSKRSAPYWYTEV